MKALLTSFVLLGLACTVAAQETPAPKPGPEHKRLEIFAGAWRMEATMHESPLGPAGKVTGTETCRMFDGGFHLTCDSTGSGPMGTMKGHVVLTWDRTAKQYRYFAVNNLPDAEQATGGVSGNTWTWIGKTDLGPGKSVHSRFTLVEKSPTVHTAKWEVSEDGKTWKVVMEGTSTKAGS